MNGTFRSQLWSTQIYLHRKLFDNLTALEITAEFISEAGLAKEECRKEETITGAAKKD